MNTRVMRMSTPFPARAAAPLPRPRRIGRARRILLFAFIALSAATAGAANSIALDIAVQGIESSQPPRLVEDVLVLSYKPDHPVRFVGVRFAHESWRILHPYSLNEHGVFVLDYPMPEGVTDLRYRMVVDGLWTTDPANPRTDVDAFGIAFSLYTLDSEPVRPILNPRTDDDGELTFVFKGNPGRRVAIVGDFNNWDPFMDPMDETAPGTYAITLRVPPGAHWYYFFTDGRRVLDRFNSQTGVNPDGGTTSYFVSPS